MGLEAIIRSKGQATCGGIKFKHKTERFHDEKDDIGYYININVTTMLNRFLKEANSTIDT